MLTEKDKRFLQRSSARYRYAIIIGFAFALAGGLYGVWSVKQLDPERAPNPGEAFDRPIAQLAILAAPYEERLNEIEPHTEREEILLKELKARSDMTIRSFLMLFRIIFVNLVLTVGVVLIAVGLTQKQFLDIIKKVRLT